MHCKWRKVCYKLKKNNKNNIFFLNYLCNHYWSHYHNIHLYNCNQEQLIFLKFRNYNLNIPRNRYMCYNYINIIGKYSRLCSILGYKSNMRYYQNNFYMGLCILKIWCKFIIRFNINYFNTPHLSCHHNILNCKSNLEDWAIFLDKIFNRDII